MLQKNGQLQERHAPGSHHFFNKINNQNVLVLGSNLSICTNNNSYKRIIRNNCHDDHVINIKVIIDMPLKLDVSAAPDAKHWRAIEDPPTEYHRVQTQLCAVKLDKAKLTEETPNTLPDSTTGPTESQEPNKEGMTILVYSHHVEIIVRYTHQPALLLI